MITLEAGSFGWDFVIRDEGTNETVLVQTDYDYPGVADSFGWSLRGVGSDDCEHDGTDGTVDCECGLTATDFIGSAREYLTDNVGATAEDPGYFGGE